MWFCCFCATVLIEKKDIYFPLHRKAPDRSKMTNISFFFFFGVLLAESLSIILTPMFSHSKMSFLLDERMEGRICVPSLRSSDIAGWQTIPPSSHLFLLTRFYCSFLLLFCGSFGCWRLSQVWRQTLRDSTNFVFGEQLTWRWLSWRVKPRAEL